MQLTVRKTKAGPGGKTLPLGGAVNLSDLRSCEMDASMNTRRALEWNAWLEKPRSMSDTAHAFSEAASRVSVQEHTHLGPY